MNPAYALRLLHMAAILTCERYLPISIVTLKSHLSHFALGHRRVLWILTSRDTAAGPFTHVIWRDSVDTFRMRMLC